MSFLTGYKGHRKESPFRAHLAGQSYRGSETLQGNQKICLAFPIVTILLDTGLRVSELCGLDIEDMDLDDQSALVIGGKGEKGPNSIIHGRHCKSCRIVVTHKKIQSEIDRDR